DIGGAPFATIRADRERPDLSLSSGGFELTLPVAPSVLSEESVDVIDVRTGKSLAGSGLKLSGLPSRHTDKARLSRALQFLRGRNPTIAIIVPIYNAVADVEACLQALANNTKTDCRLLLIDDAS